ncbi:mucin-6 [Columba livia]|uniref:mucin-6 n=1 Tax=Columba livia TaxID=8932 RepID=UPI0031BA7E18
MFPTVIVLIFCSFLQSAAFEGNYWPHFFLQKQKESLQRILSKDSCSTWGGGHFSTFDKYQYDFTGTCNYIFATVCDETSPDFNIQLRRGLDKKIARIIIELGPSVVIVEKGSISVRSVGVIKLPYTSNGIQIAPYGRNVRLVAKMMEMELVVMWNNDDYLMVLTEKKYMGKTCGMCGNYDGYELNEFVSEGKLLDTYKFAALQKMDDPSEICLSEEISISTIPHKKYAVICSQLLNLVSPTCSVPKDGFVVRCQLDMQDCSEPGQNNCTCSTLSEYSRQCAMSHQMVFNWRTENFCSVGKCSANQIYEECGSPCIKTCSNPEYSCSSHCTYGCFCPEGAVLDDISKNRTCVHINQCPCTLNGKTYAPGETMKAACRICKCTMGQWNCKDLPCPGRCSLEGGSFVTTFDSRSYRFHGVCTYVLMKSSSLPHNGTLMAVYEKSGYSHSETSLSAVIYLSSKDKIVISQNELLTDDDELKRLPYRSGDITIFRQSSMYIQMHTTFGLELVVQTSPVFQAYVKVGSQFKGRTLGLCGNYNGDTTDDFMTSMDITEGTASLFVDSWRAGNCHPALERDTDPCALSQLNKISAETHCSILTKKGTVFEKCHAVVNPISFYKRCVYQACNYEETFPYICSALGSYARTCSSMGLILEHWRNSVDNCTITCTGNQTFSYNTQACDRTCLSLSNRALECHPTDIPIEGCHCPIGMYLNHKNECVHKSHCPCYLEDRKYILPDQSIITGGITCYCVNGRLSCTGKPQNPAESCKAPKKFVSCSDSLENKYGAACAPTCQMLATGIECIPTKCESGCICADGLYENLDGRCVPAEDCPCEYGGLAYGKGEQIQTECEICTCTKGKWKCAQKSKCSSTCNLYGEGHITTFDGQRFVFDGNCEYILAMDGCSVNRPVSSFKIVTENVICGKTGVTCSRSISIYFGNLTLILRDETFTVSGENPGVRYNVKKNALHLMFDIIIPGKYNMTLIWNKHMNFFIKISRETQETICGLCGNYNGNMKDDFETRSKYVASNELEFVNSWKENPLCGDVYFVVDPCSKNPYRKAWAEKTCSIINSQVFSACHNKVNRMPYYEACVRDSCGCDIGGDCECMCDAIAVYAMACLDKGICIDWRTPEFCPVYCEYYNSHQKTGSGNAYSYGYNNGNCTWHYRPCNCPNQNYKYVNIEGCYNCSHDEYFDYEKERCMPCGEESTSATPEVSLPSTGITVQPEVIRSSTTSTLPTVPSSSSSATAVSTKTTNPTITSKITVPRISSASPPVTIKSTTESEASQATTLHHHVPVVVTQRRPTKPPLVQHLITQKTTPAMSASSTTVPREASPTSSPEVPLTMISPSLSSLFTTSTSSASIPSSAVSSTRLRPSHPAFTHKKITMPHIVLPLTTQKTTASASTSITSKTSVSQEARPATSTEVMLTRISTSPSSPPAPSTLLSTWLPSTAMSTVSSTTEPTISPKPTASTTSTVKTSPLPSPASSPLSTVSSTWLSSSHPAFIHKKTTVPHILPPLTTQKTTASAFTSSTSRTSVSREISPATGTEVTLKRTSPSPSSLPAPRTSLSTQLPSAATFTVSSSPSAPTTSPKPTPTTLKHRPSSTTTSAPKESPAPESSTPSTAKTSPLPSPASSPSSTVSSTWLSSSHPALIHEKTSMPYIVPPLTTEKTTATSYTSITSKTSVSREAKPATSTEVMLTSMSPSPSSSPAPSSPLSTHWPSATTSTVFSTSPPTTSPKSTPTTLKHRPSSTTTSAPKESPAPESSTPSTAKTSPLPSPASSPSSTVSSTWLSSSHPAAFTHKKTTVSHVVPPLITLKTTATTSTISTSRTSVSREISPATSTEVTLTSMSPSPSSPPAISTLLSTQSPSTSTSTVFSTSAPTTSPKPTPTTLKHRPSPTTTSAPKESPAPESSTPSTAKTSPLPSPASSPSSTVSSTWLSSSHLAAFTHKKTSMPHVVPPLTTHKTTASTPTISTSRTSVSREISPATSTEVTLTSMSPSPSSPPAISTLLSTQSPSTSTSPVFSTSAPTTSPKPTPTTLKHRPSSTTTSAPKESPAPESSTPSTAKTSPWPSPASSPSSTVSSTWLSSSYSVFTHKKTTVPHIVPPLSTQKTTATTSTISTSRTSVSREISPATSTEVTLTSMSPSPSSPSAISTLLSTQSPSTSTSPVFSTSAPTTSPKPTPTTLKHRPSSTTTSAPKESPAPESSTPSTAKTSPWPSPASSPSSTVSSTWLSSSYSVFTHKKTTVPHVVPPLSTQKTTATTSTTSTSRTSVSREISPATSTEVTLTSMSPSPSSPSAISTLLSTQSPSTSTSPVFSTSAPTTSPKPTPTTLKHRPSSTTTSAPKESPAPESSTPSTAKTSPLPSPASSPSSTVSSTWLSSSYSAVFTHKKTTVPHVVPPLSTQKTTATTSTISTSRTSVSREISPATSTEVTLTSMSPSPSSPPAISTLLSTQSPSTSTSTVFSTSAPTTSPKPTPTTLKHRPSSTTTSAPKESPAPESSTPSTAKTSPLPSPASSPSSTVSSTWLSSSHLAAFTHKKTSMPHVVPPLTTHKTTASTPTISTSRTSVSREISPATSTEVTLTSMSPSPSSPPAVSTLLSTQSPSTSTSPVFSTSAPTTSPKPTPTTLKHRPSSTATSAPKESPAPESSTPSTAKTSPLPSPASSPSSTVSSTWPSSSHPVFAHKKTTVPHVVAPLTTQKTTATTSTTSISKTYVSKEPSPATSTEVTPTRMSPIPSSPPATSTPLSTYPVFSTSVPTTRPKPTPTTLKHRPSSTTMSAPKESPAPESSTTSTAKTSPLPSPASSPSSTVSSTWPSSSNPAFTHKKTTVPHVVPPLTMQKMTAATSASSTSKTSVSKEMRPTSSTEVTLTRTSSSPSSPPAPRSSLSTQLPSAATSTISSTSAPTTSPMSTLTSLTTSTFRSAESATYFSSQNTTFTPYGKTTSSVIPTSISAKSTPVLIPSVLSTTITFAPSVITTASTEAFKRTSLRTTTLTTTRTTSSPPFTSKLSTSLSSVVPLTVPQEHCRELKYEEKITYKGCSTNVTLSKCEGSCPSSTKLNIEKMMVDTACGCCRPRQLLKQEFQLPCKDPDNPGKRLITEIIVFRGCVCNFDSCIH